MFNLPEQEVKLLSSQRADFARVEQNAKEAAEKVAALEEAHLALKVRLLQQQAPSAKKGTGSAATLKKLHEDAERLQRELALAQASEAEYVRELRMQLRVLSVHLPEMPLLHRQYFQPLNEDDIPAKFGDDNPPIYAVNDTTIHVMHAPLLGSAVCVKNQKASSAVLREAIATSSLKSPCLVPTLLHFPSRRGRTREREEPPQVMGENDEDSAQFSSPPRRLRLESGGAGVAAASDYQDLPQERQVNDRYIIVTPYYPLGDLAKNLPNVTIGSLRVHAREILEAINELHSSGIIHGDIKPQNVFVHNDGRWILGDFGSSKLIDANTMTSSMTLRYAAPETLGSESVLKTSGTDVFGVGLLLLEAYYRCDRGAALASCTMRWIAEAARGEPFRSFLPDGQADLSGLAARADDAADFATFVGTMLKREPLERPDASTLLEHPFVMDSRTAVERRVFFSARLRDRGIAPVEDKTVRIERRNSALVLEQCVEQGLALLPATKRLRVEFTGEVGVDATGLTKELYSVIFDETRRRGLFVASDSNPPGAALHLVEDEKGCSGHCALLEVAGWLLMRSVVSAAGGFRDALLPQFRCPFTMSRFLLRMLLADSLSGQTADASEHGEVDPESARRVVDGVRDPATSVRAFDVAFSNGRAVTASNAHEWATEYRTNALLKRCEGGIEALRRGFRRDLVLVGLVRDLVGNSASVLQELVCQSFVSPFEVAGLCTFRNFPPASSVPVWMRSTIYSLDQTTLRKWLRWSTGGYSAAAINLFFVAAPEARPDNVRPLPVAHTCFNSVDLPDYPSEDELRKKLLLAIEETDMGNR